MSAGPENISNELAQKNYELEAMKAQDARRLETIKVLLDEWKWRHQHCWKSLNRGVLSAVTVSLAPYIWLLREGDNAFKSGLGYWVLIFPLIAALVVQAVVSLFAGEYIRCRPVLAKYNELLGEDSPNPPDKKATNWKMSVAQWTILGYGAGATLISLGNAYIITLIAKLDITTVNNRNILLWIASLLVSIFFIVYDIWLMGRTRAGVQSRISSGQESANVQSLPKPDPKSTQALPDASINEAKQDGARAYNKKLVNPVNKS